MQLVEAGKIVLDFPVTTYLTDYPKENGDKMGACDDLKLASDLDPEEYYDYYLKWCSNCVDVEHALDNIETDTGLQQYHTHRAINEAQDPLGTIEIDQLFHDRYGVNAPPVVVFNGTVMKTGSVTDAESLESEFTALAQQNMEIMGTSTFTWNSTSNSTGTAAWSIEPQDLTFINQLDGYDDHSSLF